MKACQKCGGHGWVCENHPDTPWGDAPGQCECGAGQNCSCNPDGDVDWEFVMVSVNPSDVTTLH